MSALAMPEKKERLVNTAVALILRSGYSGTSVDDICAESGVTKGSFFHYFSSKEEICQAAMQEWMRRWHGFLEGAELDRIADPLDRVHALFDLMARAYTTSPLGPGCMVGTVAQERSLPHPAIGDECHGYFEEWVARTSQILAEAKAAHPPKTDFDPVEVAWWLQSFVQGTLLIAKTRFDTDFIHANIRHCRAYIDGLFGVTEGRLP